MYIEEEEAAAIYQTIFCVNYLWDSDEVGLLKSVIIVVDASLIGSEVVVGICCIVEVLKGVGVTFESLIDIGSRVVNSTDSVVIVSKISRCFNVLASAENCRGECMMATSAVNNINFINVWLAMFVNKVFVESKAAWKMLLLLWFRMNERIPKRLQCRQKQQQSHVIVSY